MRNASRLHMTTYNPDVSYRLVSFLHCTLFLRQAKGNRTNISWKSLNRATIPSTQERWNLFRPHVRNHYSLLKNSFCESAVGRGLPHKREVKRAFQMSIEMICWNEFLQRDFDERCKVSLFGSHHGSQPSSSHDGGDLSSPGVRRLMAKITCSSSPKRLHAAPVHSSNHPHPAPPSPLYLPLRP